MSNPRDAVDPPAAGVPPFEQEIRFAVVLYGGVSLAIYINGVAQELLRMVRSTAAGVTDHSGTETVYRKASGLMALGRTPGAPASEPNTPKARFVVDIISGTSAGGINGVALAKCLALKSPDMKALESTWLEKAQIDDLFNKQNGSATSLLDSAKMYGLVFDTLKAMNPGKTAAKDNVADGFADQIDLFVTTTDLNGLYQPLKLAGDAGYGRPGTELDDGKDQAKSVNERVHKTVFRFSYTSEEFAQNNGIFPPTNHFTQEHDPMLAFAARCTSSFPIAFEPMTFDAVQAHTNVSSQDKTRFEHFFPAYKAQDFGFWPTATEHQRLPLGQRPFADGGYLDNRPFSYAIDLIQYRSSTRPVQRKLLFVDPFPEYQQDHQSQKSFNFVENGMLALTSLPRYQTIRSDIDRINDNNRRQDRLKALWDDLDEFMSAEESGGTPQRAAKSFWEAPLNPTVFDRGQPEDPFQYSDERLLRGNSVHQLIEEHRYSKTYSSYHILRKQAATGDLAEAIADFAGYRTGGDEAYFIRLLLRSWRRQNFNDTPSALVPSAPKPASESGFLLDFDIEYERRHVNDVITLIDRVLSKNPNDGEEAILEGISHESLMKLRTEFTKQLVSLYKAKKEFSAESMNPLVETLTPAFEALMKERRRRSRYKIADTVYESNKRDIDELMNLIRNIYGDALSRVRSQAKTQLSGFHNLAIWYANFPWRDSLSLPLLDGTNSREHTLIEVYRVSPADDTLWPKSVERPDRKLAGIAVGAFGGFLQKSWRQNDIMWGRLDGAERIILSLLPDAGDRSKREALIAEAQDIILAESLTKENSRVLIDWLMRRIPCDQKIKPPVEDVVAYITTIFPKTAALVGSGWLTNFIRNHYELPPSPKPETILGWASSALDILGGMIGNLAASGGSDPGSLSVVGTIGKRISTSLHFCALLLTQFLRFAVPGRIGYLLFSHWMFLVALAGALLVFANLGFGITGVTSVGCIAILGALLAWIVRQAFICFVLRQGRSWIVFMFILLGIVIAAAPWTVGAIQIYGDIKSFHLPSLSQICARIAEIFCAKTTAK